MFIFGGNVCILLMAEVKVFYFMWLCRLYVEIHMESLGKFLPYLLSHYVLVSLGPKLFRCDEDGRHLELPIS